MLPFQERVDKLKVALQVPQFTQLVVNPDYGWPGRTALCVIDCILSLNRPYDSVVLPRVTSFCQKHPEVTDLLTLSNLLERYTEPGSFIASELNYSFVGRENILREVVSAMLGIGCRYPGETEWDRLVTWAHATTPGEYRTIGVRGFALAGFQYLRMLFGVQTTKPDMHIIRFVSDVTGAVINDFEALALLEAAAKQIGLPLREVDNVIWQAGARNKSQLTLAHSVRTPSLKWETSGDGTRVASNGKSTFKVKLLPRPIDRYVLIVGSNPVAHDASSPGTTGRRGQENNGRGPKNARLFYNKIDAYDLAEQISQATLGPEQ